MSLHSRAYKILCSRYRDVLTRVRSRNGVGRRDPNPSFHGINLEPLEPRVLLSGSPTDPLLTDFVLYGTSATVVDKDVTVHDGLVGSSGDISVGKNASVLGLMGGGGLSVEQESVVDGDVRFNGVVTTLQAVSLTGDVDSGGAVTIGNDSTVSGSITSADAVTLGSNVSVAGNVTEFGSPDVFVPVALPPVSVIVTDPDNDIETDKNQTLVLAPGSYGDLTLDQNNVLSLSAGEYTFDQVTVSKNLLLNLDTTGGEISILVSGDVAIEKNLDVVLTGDAGQVYLESHGDVSVGANSDWVGTIYAPTGQVDLLNGVSLTGAAYGDSVYVEKNAQLTLDPADRLLGPGDVDPPVLTAALANDTGVSDSDTITSDPTVAGTVTDDSALNSVLLSIPELGAGPFDVTGDVSPVDGSFSFDRAALELLLGSPLVDGSYTLEFVAEDVLGNVSDPFEVVLTLDTTAPGVSLASPPSGLLTNTNVTVEGQATDGVGLSLVEQTVDGGTFSPVTNDAAGNFSFDTTLTLDGSADGSHTIQVRATDLAGNVSAVTETTIELDTQVSVPVIEVTEHATGVVLTSGDVTAETLLVLDGTGDAGSTVTLNESTLGLIGTAVVDASGGTSGAWVIDEAGTVFAEGTYSFTATATDDAGNVSVASDAFVVVIDTTPPDVSLDIAPVGVITNTNLTITGSVSDPANVTLLEASIDGGSFFNVTLEPDGTFSFDTTFLLDGTDDGLHTVSVRATDTAGNVSDPVEATFELDTQIASPVVATVDQDTGVSNSDQITNDTTLIVTGTAEPNSTVTVSETTLGVIGTVITDAAGQWSLDATSTVLAEGSHSFTAVAVDVAGNTSITSAALVVQVDVTDPTVTIDSPADGLVSNTNVTVTGVAADTVALDLVEVQIDGDSGGTFSAVTVQPDGSYSLDTTYLLDGTEDGVHTVAVRATDVAGNVSTLTQVTWTLDTQVDAPLITSITQDTGVSDSDQLTSDTRLLFHGTAEPGPGSTVTLNEMSLGIIGTALTDTSGGWTVDGLATTLAEGTYSFTATTTDVAGNVSVASVPFAVVVDATGPTIVVDSPVEGSTVSSNIAVTGTVTDPNGVSLLEAAIDFGTFFAVVVEPDGSYSFDTTFALDGSDDGPHTVTLRATDDAGNVSADEVVSFNLLAFLDPPVIVGIDQDTGAGDGITSDATLLFNGTAQPGSTVALSEATLGVIGSATVDPTGVWMIDATSMTFAEGTYAFTATASTGGGSISDPSAVFNVTIDQTAPLTPTLDLDPQSDTDPVGDQQTYLSRVTLVGTTDSNVQVQLVETGDVTTSDASGAFSFTVEGLIVGDNTFTAVTSDVAGNTSQTAVTIERVLIPDSILLEETTGWLVTETQLIELGQDEGSRTLRFAVDASFDTTDTASPIQDMLLVYLVDPLDNSTTLLDRKAAGAIGSPVPGSEGTALFALVGDRPEYRAGLVQFDGETVEVDLTSLADLTEGLLVFQLVNSDNDTTGHVLIRDITNTVDPEGQADLVMPLGPDALSPGGTLDLSTLTASTDVQAQVTNVRIDDATGRYTADVRLFNGGASVGRQAAVVFPGLPAGVTMVNASGVDTSGDPYINLRLAMPTDGLGQGALSAVVQIAFDNPSAVRLVLNPQVLVSSPNQAPVWDPVSNITVTIGDTVEVPLTATDADGDIVRFALAGDGSLPTGRLDGSGGTSGGGALVFMPAPGEEGTYTFDLVASDGSLTDTQTVTLTVNTDPVTTTRLSGVVLDTLEQPLVGVPIELGTVTTTTDATGAFTIEFTGPAPSDTLFIRGEALTGPEVYPFIAEKVPLLLGRDLYDNVNNVVVRPIYLPALDIANGDVVDPTQDTVVDTAAIPGAQVFIAAGTLEDQSGSPFTGTLSITEVPVDRTPAALPDSVRPGLVVTIQPGEMVFTEPAPLTLPNVLGLPAGSRTELWSINPVTGDFDVVGAGQVSADGTIIETVSGGILNSSWHFFPPLPWTEPNTSDRNKDDRCDNCEDMDEFTSVLLSHSGTVLETHHLPSYQSLGASRGVSLRYDSLRADPRPIVHVAVDVLANNVNLWGRPVPNNATTLAARVVIDQGSVQYEAPGHTWTTPAGSELSGHFWTPTPGSHDVAIQPDLRALASGVYTYDVQTGLFWDTDDVWTGRWESLDQQELIHINEIDSPFGAGWSIMGLQRIVEGADGRVLLIDGDAGELLFIPDGGGSGGGGYVSPIGDFSTLEKLPGGTFQRTMRDQTVYEFDAEHRLSVMRDRNGNETRYEYNTAGLLTKIIDPANLETLFDYSGPTGGGVRVTSITDPASRVTLLEYDTAGNLIKITDPDTSTRQFEYDADHHMIAETDQRGEYEQAFYDFAGRATHAISKNSQTIQSNNAQTVGLAPFDQTGPGNITPLTPPIAAAEPNSFYADRNGRVTRTVLDQAGQAVARFDSVGPDGTNERDDNNLITQQTDGLGRITSYEYDANGNLTRIRDSLSGGNGFNNVIASAGERHEYDFALSQDTLVVFDSLTNSSSLVWSLSGPSGQIVTERRFSVSDAGNIVDPALELISGNYTLTVDGSGSATGNYEFRLLDLSPGTPGSTTSIAPGTVVSDQADPARSTVAYQFDADANQKFYFDYQSRSGYSTTPTWRLIDPFGQDVFRTNFTNDQELFLPFDGTYTLLIEGQSFDSGSLGQFSFNAQPVTNDHATLTLGDTVSGAVDHVGQQDHYTFTLAADAQLYLDSLTHRNNLRWSLTGPSGAVVNRWRFDQSDTTSRANAVRNLIAGDYTLTVDGDNDAVGDYSFRLLDIAAASSATVITPSTPGTIVTDSVTPGNSTAIYRFDANAGDPLFFDIRARSGFSTSTSWRLVDPIGRDVFLSSFHPNGADEEHDMPLDGTYTLMIEGNTNDTGAQGDFEFSLVSIVDTTASLTLSSPVDESIEHPGQQRHYTFTLTTDAQLVMDVFRGDNGITWTLAGPRGVEVDALPFHTTDYRNVDDPTLNLIPGDYTLTIDGLGDRARTIGFNLIDLTAPGTTPGSATTITPGTVVNDTLTPSNTTGAYRFNAVAGQPYYFDAISISGFSGTLFTRPFKRLIDPFGNDVFLEAFVSERTFTPEFDGDYTLLVEGYFGDPNPSGQISFNVQPISDDTTAVTLTSLANGITGVIDHAGQSDHYTFTTASDTLIAFDARTSTSGFVWSLTGPRGQIVTDRSFQASDSDDLDDAAVSLVAGDYTLTVTGSGDTTGTYDFAVFDLSPTGTASSITVTTPGNPASPVNTTITPALGSVAYRFDALAGDELYFDYQARSGFSFAPYWRLVDPIGRDVFLSSFTGDQTATIPFDGTYSLLIEGRYFDSGASGNITFAVNQIADDTAAITLDTVTSAGTSGDIDHPGQRDLYTFTLASDTLVTFDALTDNATLRWTLTGPFGDVVSDRSFNSTDSGNRSNAVMDLIAGDYTLTVQGAGDTTGLYDFKLLDFTPGTPDIVTVTPGTPVSGSVTPANTTALYQFNALAGDRFDFDYQSSSGFGTAPTTWPYWRLVDPFGRDVFLSPLSTDRTETLAYDGTYTLSIEGRVTDPNAQGDFTFDIVFVTNDGAPTLPTGTTITPGSPVTGSIATGGEQDVYNFTLTADTLAAFDTISQTGSLVWSLEGPRGTVVSSRLLNSSDWRNIDDPALTLVPGDYALTVSGFNATSTGSYQFELHDLASVTALTPGTQVNATTSPASATAAYQLTANAGDRFFFDSLSVSGFNTGTSQPYWRLIDPVGRDVFLTPLNSDREVTIAYDGQYTLLVEAFPGDTHPTGSFSFNVHEIIDDTTSLTLGTPVSATFDHPGQQDHYTFTLASDTLVAFDARSSRSDVRWTLQGPTGPVFDNFRGFTNSDSGNLTNAVLPLTAGSYTLTIDGVNDASGQYDFNLLDLTSTAPGNTTTITPGTDVSGSVTPANATAAYTFTANAGDEYYFDAITRSGFGGTTLLQPYWRLVDPFGRDVFNTPLSADVSLDLEFTGTYTLLFEGRAADSGAQGDFTFNAQPVTDDTIATTLAALTSGGGVSGAIDHAGQQDHYTFTVTADTRVVFDSMTTNPNLRWSLTGPRGQLVTDRTITQSDSGSFPGDVAIDLVPGDYTLTVDAVFDRTDVYSFRFLDITPGTGANTTTMTPGVTVNGSVAPANGTAAYTFTANAGDAFYFDYLSRSGFGATPYWRLIDPHGRNVFHSLFWFSSFASYDHELTLTHDGDYTLLIEGRVSDANAGGSFSFNAQPISDETAALTPGTIYTNAIDHAGQKDRYTFTLAADTNMVMDVLSNSAGVQWSLTGPHGVVVTDRALRESDSFDRNHPVMHLVAGEYTLTLDGDRDDTGTYSFRLLDLAAPGTPGTPGSPGSTTSITPGAVVNDTVTPANGTVIYTFTANAGDDYYFDYQSRSGFSTSAYWRLVDPFGRDLFLTNLALDQELSLPFDGTYHLLIEGRYSDTGSQGDFTFNAQPVADDHATLTVGAMTSGAINHVGQRDHYTFSLDDDTLIAFDSLANRDDLTWSLTGPRGVVVTDQRFDRSDGQLSSSAIALVAGDYTLTVDGTNDATGTYGLRLLDLADVPGLMFTQPVTATLAPASSAAAYTFEAAAGQRFYFDFQSHSGFTFTPRWRLIDPFGRNVFNASFDADQDRTLDFDGMYTLILEGLVSDPAASGDVTFALHRVEDVTAPLALNTLNTGTVNTPGQVHRLTFTGQTGQHLIFDGLDDTSGSIQATLTDPSGQSVFNLSSTSFDSSVLVLEAMGTYTLEIDGDGDTTGDYQFRLTDLDNAQPLTAGATTSGSLNPADRLSAYRFTGQQGQRLEVQQVSATGTNASWRWVAPDGRDLVTRAFNLDLPAVTLPVDGDYFLIVDGPANAATAPIDYQFMVNDVSDAPVTPSGLGTVVSGTIAAGQVDTYNFTANAATRVFLERQLLNTSSLIAEIRDPDGQVVHNTQSSTTPELLVLPRSGQYTLEVRGRFSSSTGSYQLRVADLSPAPGGEATAISLDTTYTATLSTTGATVAYTLAVTAGQRIYYDGLDLPDSDNVRARLYSPDTGEIFDLTEHTNTGPLTLTQTGTYLLLFDNRSTSGGTADAVFRLHDVDAATPLILNNLFNGSLANGYETQLFAITAAAGQRLYLDGNSTTTSGGWALYDANNQLLFNTTNGRLDDGEVVLPIAGTYTLAVVGQRTSPVNYSFTASVTETLEVDGLNPSASGATGGRTFTYDPTFNLVTSITDELGRVTLFERDPVTGNEIAMTRVVGQVDDLINGETDDVTTTRTYASEGLVDTITDPLGRVTDFDYDLQGRMITITSALGTADQTIVRFEYDTAGNRTAVIDENNNRTEFEYDDNGRLELIRDALLNETTFTYDLAGNLLTTTDPLLRVTENEYDELGRLVLTRDALLNEFHTVYDHHGNVTATIDPLGNQTQFTYDARNRMTETLAADGGVTRFGYDLADNRTQVIDPENNSTLFLYDPRNRLSTQVDALGNTTRFRYDSADNLTQQIDALGRVTQFSYDDLDRMTAQTQIASDLPDRTTTSAYDKASNLVSVTDPLGIVTTFEYDDLNRLITQTTAATSPDEGIQRFEYDPAGNLTASIDENSHRTEFEYDDLYRNTLIRDALLNETDYAYDAVGNLTSVADARNNVTVFEYDDLNRQVLSRDAVLNESHTTYDAVDNVLTATDELNRTTSNTYDAVYRLATTTDPNNGVTTYTYDLNGNLLSLTDPVNNTTTYAYDALNRLITTTDPLLAVTSVEYDEVSNRTAIVDANDRRIESTYDGFDRLISETWLTPDTGTGRQIDNVIQYTYDASDNLLSLADDFSSLTFTYDDRYRLKTVDNAGTPAPGSPGNAPHVVLDYTYDAVGNVLSVTDSIAPAPGSSPTAAGLTGYVYDDLNRLTELTQTVASGATAGSGIDKRVDFTYNELGQFDSISRFSDLTGLTIVATTDYVYDTLNRLTDLTHTDPLAAVLNDYGFTFDDASQITQITDVDGPTDYNYDDNSRLTSADDVNNTSGGDETYTYDANGNRISSNLHGSGYVTGDANQVLSDGTYNYTYDDVGNLITRVNIATGQFRGFDYDHRNRLTRVTDRASAGGIITQEVNYTYDALNRRITKTVDTDGDGAGGEVATHFVYDREDVILDFTDSDGSGPIAPVLAVRYLHGPGADMILAQEDVVASTVLWLLTDHLGTTRDLVDASGGLVNHIKYDSFGNVVSQTNANQSTRYLYTGRELETETGLYYYRARFYDSTLGKFIQRDPMGFIDGTNYYEYVGSNSISFNDPTGLFVSGADRERLQPQFNEAHRNAQQRAADLARLQQLISRLEQVGEDIRQAQAMTRARMHLLAAECELLNSQLQLLRFMQAQLRNAFVGGTAIFIGAAAAPFLTFGGGFAGATASGAATGAASFGGAETVTQAVEIGTGMRPGFDLGQIFTTTAFGGAFGGVFGAAGHGARQLATKNVPCHECNYQIWGTVHAISRELVCLRVPWKVQ